jgi:hypothetical protein
MTALETYLRELRDIRSTGAGVEETSYYTPLANLFNEIGKSLKPRVRCVINLQNRGAGLPDGGLFTPDQFQRREGEPVPGQTPSRGVIEVKGTKDDAWVTADGEQVSRYWGKYGQVLVTNYPNSRRRGWATLTFISVNTSAAYPLSASRYGVLSHKVKVFTLAW